MKTANFEEFVTSIPEWYVKMGWTGSNRQIWLFSLIQVFLQAKASFPWYFPPSGWGGGTSGTPQHLEHQGTSNSREMSRDKDLRNQIRVVGDDKKDQIIDVPKLPQWGMFEVKLFRDPHIQLELRKEWLLCLAIGSSVSFQIFISRLMNPCKILGSRPRTRWQLVIRAATKRTSATNLYYYFFLYFS